MLTLALLLCSSAAGASQTTTAPRQLQLSSANQIITFDDHKVEFFRAFHGIIDTTVIHELHTDFKTQIAETMDPRKLDTLLRQLPFEPDNLQTDDCTFHACCNALMLNEYLYSSISSEEKANLLETLGHVAVLTYLRHSTQFFEDVFKRILEECKNRRGLSLSLLALNKYCQDYATTKEKESDLFSEYKKYILEKMASYITKKNIPIDPSATNPNLKVTIVQSSNTKSLKITYNFKDSKCHRFLINYTQQKIGHIVQITRRFMHLTNGQLGKESGKVLFVTTATPTTLYIQYKLSPALNSTAHTIDIERTPVSEQTLQTQLQAQPELYKPSVALQIIDDPISGYLKEPDLEATHQIQVSTLVLPERPDQHAIVTSYAVATQRNTWFASAKGLRFTRLTQQIQNWTDLTYANFEMYCNLSVKK